MHISVGEILPSSALRHAAKAAAIMAVVALAAAVACSDPEIVEVEKIVEVPGETQVVEKIVEVPGETQVVEKIVEVEVEKVIIITPTPESRKLAKVAYLNAGTEPPTLDPALASDDR